MKKYTLGFIFTQDFKNVLLIHKLSPAWQVGKVNGIGGKVEIGESNIDCIVREVYEETALKIGKELWREIGKIKEEDGEVAVFTAIYKGDKNNAISNDKEIITWYPVDNLPINVISNLRWLIPLSLDKIKNNLFKDFIVTYETN